jgi:hypothetical protein
MLSSVDKVSKNTSTLKMETVCFSETLASADESTRRQNPEEQHYHPHRHENLRSHIEEAGYHIAFTGSLRLPFRHRTNCGPVSL